MKRAIIRSKENGKFIGFGDDQNEGKTHRRRRRSQALVYPTGRGWRLDSLPAVRNERIFEGRRVATWMNPRFLRLVQLGLKWGGSDYDRVGGVERSDRRLYMEGCPNKVIVILITARLSELSLLSVLGARKKSS
jgi:hypothetical protein